MEKYRRYVLYAILAVVGVLLWNEWLAFKAKHTPKTETALTQSVQTKAHSGTYTPPTFTPGSHTTPAKQQVTNALEDVVVDKSRLIHIKTDVLNIAIDTLGGNLVSAKLLKYPSATDQANIWDKIKSIFTGKKKIVAKTNGLVQILKGNLAELYIAQSGITNSSAKGSSKQIKYSVTQKQYQLAPGSQKLVVTLTGKTDHGIVVQKSYTLNRDSYAIAENTQLTNRSAKIWRGSVYNQITRRNVPVKTALHARSYDGASISSPDKPYSKISYSDLDESNISRNIKGGWMAMQQRYFLSVWVPNNNQMQHYYSHVATPADNSEQKIYTVGYVSPQISLAPNKSATQKSTFYVGPEIAKRLEVIAPNLQRTIDYGWLWWLSQVIFWLMSILHGIVGNWGWSIVLVTFLIKLVFYPLSAKSYRSMARMRLLTPKLKALKERYVDDKQAMSKATMELYRKEKVNPMGGCLPLLIQIPVFFALYYVLIEAVQLRQAPFILWIKDLSVMDPYFVLPILMGLSMLLQQKLSPPPPDPTQAKVMMFLPLIFTIFFMTFPAGLVLYWLTNNCLSVAQQWYVMKTFDPNKAPKKKKRKK